MGRAGDYYATRHAAVSCRNGHLTSRFSPTQLRYQVLPCTESRPQQSQRTSSTTTVHSFGCSKSMKIPSVTEGDLRDFHSKHFATTPLPAVFVPENEALTAIKGDDDALGYYDDGVKRTLTDGQIAIFRHSETQAIIREIRQEKETRASLAESWANKDGDPQSLGSGVIQRSMSLCVDAGATKRKPKKKRKRDRENTWEERKTGSNIPRQDATDEWTPRRQARELDDNKDVTVDLDYGA
ncbi:hypothetical protein AOQ84DRAFT_393026 [Glonium stellatum]|uniref:Uncharacterized protein n=1 Tax=Glonium stellatum TaxID=574774 RepID=A0A8E2JMN3_9PEZI|nr:hypothetical protein AOQ84DRAFT_393026 [Glonium stellatum]